MQANAAATTGMFAVRNKTEKVTHAIANKRADGLWEYVCTIERILRTLVLSNTWFGVTNWKNSCKHQEKCFEYLLLSWSHLFVFWIYRDEHSLVLLGVNVQTLASGDQNLAHYSHCDSYAWNQIKQYVIIQNRFYFSLIHSLTGMKICTQCLLLYFSFTGLEGKGFLFISVINIVTVIFLWTHKPFKSGLGRIG